MAEKDNDKTASVTPDAEEDIRIIHVDFDDCTKSPGPDDTVIEIDPAPNDTTDPAVGTRYAVSDTDDTTDPDEIVYIELDEPAKAVAPKRRKHKSHAAWWWTGAAVLVIGCGIGAYLLFADKPQTPPAPVDPYTTVQTDIAESNALTNPDVAPIPGLPNDPALAKALVGY